MAEYTVAEMWDSRQGSRGGDSSEELLIYDVNATGTDADAAGARAAVLATAPLVFEGLFRSKVRHKCRGGARWMVEVDYSSKDNGKPDDEEEGGFRVGVKWSITTEQTRRLVALQTIERKTAAGFDEVDFKGAINVSKDRVEGVDVPVGTAQLTLTVYRKPAELTAAYFDDLLACVGKTNDDEFYGRAEGSLLFLGVDVAFVNDSSIDPDDQEAVALPFVFQYSPPGVVSIDGFDDVNKDGWEYVWPYFAEEVDTGAGLLIAKPVQLNREKVIESADFSALGIGTDFPA